MKTRTFQMELHAPTEDNRRFIVTEDGKHFAAGTLPPDTTKEAARRVVYAMLSAYVGTDARVVVTHTNAIRRVSVWAAEWVNPYHVRVVVYDEVQEILGGYDVLLNNYRGCAAGGMARHEFQEIVDGMLKNVVDSLSRGMLSEGYQTDADAAMQTLHDTITVPLLDREFPINTKEMN
jgi:hypothetical protein